MSTCPSTGRACHSRPCINRLRGARCLLDDEREHTLEEIAAELRLDERSIRRLEEAALAKMRAALELPPQNSSTEIAMPRRFLRRFLRTPIEDGSHNRPPRRFRP